MVWAQARDGVIGADGALPWHLPEDLARFRRLTLGSTVVMGRRTWESLPDRFRPLPGRTNVVLTSDPGWSADGASRAGSVGEVLDDHDSLWVIGGGAVYTAFLPHADRLVVTEVDLKVDGDTWAPTIGPEWTPRRSAERARSTECAVSLVPTPATTTARSPTASMTASRTACCSPSLIVGASPVVPRTTRPSWACRSIRCAASSWAPARSIEPSSASGVTMAVSTRPNGRAGSEVMP